MEKINQLRPKSLAEAARMGKTHGQIDAFIREFLDEFYVQKVSSTRQQMLNEEPALADSMKTNAYLAAVAEHLCLKNGLQIPDWACKSERFLRAPFFPAGLESLKATLLRDSPTAFRRRMIFVDAEPLSRPRRDRETTNGG